MYRRSVPWNVPVAGGKAARLTGFIDVGDLALASDGDLAYVVPPHPAHPPSKGARCGSAARRASTRILTNDRFIDGLSVAPSGQTVALTVVEGDSTSNLGEVSMAHGALTSLTPLVKGGASFSRRGPTTAARSPSSRPGLVAISALSPSSCSTRLSYLSGGVVTQLVTFGGTKRSVGALARGP